MSHTPDGKDTISSIQMLQLLSGWLKILNLAVVKAVRLEGFEIYSECVCVYFYLESSVCPGNALHTGNALT